MCLNTHRQQHPCVSKSKIAKMGNYKSEDISFVCIDVLNTWWVCARRKVSDYNPEEAYCHDVTKKQADD